MRRHLIKVTVYSLMSVLGAVMIAVMAFFVRLSYGPVSLNFMTDTIQAQINRNLSGMSVTIGGAVIERAAKNQVPHFRLRNLELKDSAGNLIARAPRAAIAIKESAIFQASIVPTSLELIGPRIRVMRTLDGRIELGFGDSASEADSVAVDDSSDATASGKSDQEQIGGLQSAGGIASLIGILSNDTAGDTVGIDSVMAIRVADASIKFYDEANDSIWDIPRADLAFQRMPYGFAAVANADVSNGPKQGTWHADMTASYRRESRSFAVSLRIGDLVPANISDEVFALSQLARVKVPLAGQVEMDITDTGLITKATAEFAASAGEVGLPDYLAEPIIIDEGSLRADYDPVTGTIVVTDSTILSGSSRAQVKGSVAPVRDAAGRLTSVKIAMQARNVAFDAEGTNKSAVAVDRIDFIGTAAIDEAKLDIEDLVVMSGDTGIRLRGTITGGNESPGILLSGRIRDLSASLLKRLWPPIMAPETRQWVNDNINGGRITDGEFQVNLPVDSLAKAQRERRLPAKSINLGFRVEDVTASYLKGLPPLSAASGEAQLIDNDFNLSVTKADVQMPSGKAGKIVNSSMKAADILAVETLGSFDLDVTASVAAMIEYLSGEPLNLIRNTGFDTTKLSGDARAKVTLSLPLIRDVPEDRVIAKGKARISDVVLKEALPGIDITGGQIDLSVAGGAFEANGPVKIDGIPAKLNWQRGAGVNAKQSAVIETELDGEQRLKIGIDLGEFVRGPVAVKAVIDDLGDPEGKIAIDADLSQADLRISAIDWVRPAAKKTSASLTYYGKGSKGRRVEDLVIKGPDLLIKGGVTMAAKGGLQEANFPDIRLSDENRFAISVKNGGDGTAIALRGDSFDARPLIKSMFGKRRTPAGRQKDNPDAASTVSVTVNVDRIYAFRGEVLTGVAGQIRSRGSRVEAAEIGGNFLSGQPVVLRVTPVNKGRELRVNGRDAGAAMRAADLYGKVAGGQIEFYALMDNSAASSVKEGQLVLRNFEIRNEAALAELDSRGRPKKSGPRKEALSFKKLTLPFTTDAKFVRIGESLVRGNELGATAEGIIRKSDGAFDIEGTIIPAYAANAAIGSIPLLGDILTGGGGEGIFGVTYALGGTMEKPSFQFNPVSAIAPGIFRKLFEFSSNSSNQPRDRSGVDPR